MKYGARALVVLMLLLVLMASVVVLPLVLGVSPCSSAEHRMAAC